MPSHGQQEISLVQEYAPVVRIQQRCLIIALQGVLIVSQTDLRRCLAVPERPLLRLQSQGRVEAEHSHSVSAKPDQDLTFPCPGVSALGIVLQSPIQRDQCLLKPAQPHKGQPFAQPRFRLGIINFNGSVEVLQGLVVGAVLHLFQRQIQIAAVIERFRCR
ncbi:Uncharacterised protein [uncultured archaeon]|nr:Uncharacterised protein [uncultured archaeon]